MMYKIISNLVLLFVLSLGVSGCFSKYKAEREDAYKGHERINENEQGTEHLYEEME